MSLASSELIESSPSPAFCERLAAEKRVNVYFIPGKDKEGKKSYAYAVVSSVLHDQFMAALRAGSVPDFAVIVEMGHGEPSEETKKKMKQYYGFDEEVAENDNFAAEKAAQAG